MPLNLTLAYVYLRRIFPKKRILLVSDKKAIKRVSLIKGEKIILIPTIFSKEKMIVSGIDFTLELFRRNCKNIKVLSKLKDGSKIKNNTKILIIEGNAKKILSAERAGLNLLQHLSGISTLTARYSQKIKKNKVNCKLGLGIVNFRKETVMDKN